MLSRIVGFLFTASLLAAAAGRVSDRYALILSDAPLGRPVSRVAALSQRSQQIAATQTRLRAQLAARNIRVTGAVRTVLNAVFVAAAPDRVADLQSLPGVAAVVPLRRYHLDLNRAIPLLNGPAAWQALGGQDNAGRGVKIAIIDTGIDQNHPAFQDKTLTPPPGYPICSGADCNFTNNKVIVARSYVRMEAAGTGSNPAANSRPDDYTPRDRIGHGTAVASAAAANSATGPNATIVGMAPHAFLGNYKVFGTSAGASDDAIIQAVDDALNDGMDVASLSLGGPAFTGPLETGPACGLTGSAPCDPLVAAVQNAVSAGMIVVAASGNEGLDGNDASGNPIAGTLGTAGSPGDAPLAIGVGATSNAHRWVASVRLSGNVPDMLKNIAAQFGDGPLPNGTLTAPLRDVQTVISDPQACSTIPANSLTGVFALIERGACNFVVKVQNAESAGAVGVVLYDTSSEPIFTPGGLTSTQIPAVLVSQADGLALKSYLSSNPDPPLTLDPTPFEEILNGPPIVSDFSSRGPVTHTGAIKPEIVAVGQDLFMATEKLDAQGQLYSPTGYTIADGTSFSAPLVSGAAALVKQKNPGWTPGQVKSALVNYASQSVTTDSGGQPSVLDVGGGLLDAGASVTVPVTIEPATVSFGAINIAPLPLTQNLTLTNVSGGALSLSLSVAATRQDTTAHVSVTPSSLSLAPGEARTVTVTLSGTRPQAGQYEGVINITGGPAAAHVPYLYLVGDGQPYAIIDLNGGPPDFEGTAGEPLPADQGGIFFRIVDQYGVPVAGRSVTFGVARRGSGVINQHDSQTDANGIAGAAITLGPQPGVQSFTGASGSLTFTFSGIARLKPAISISGIVNAASFDPNNAVVPGSYITIFGSNLSDLTDQAIVPALPPNMDEVSVSFDVPSAGISVPGYIYYVSAGQINLQVPWELQGQSSVEIKVIVGESISSLVTVPVASYSPAFFQYQAPGGSALFIAALDSKNALITSSNAARRGDTIQLFANGLGPVTNQPESGLPASSSSQNFSRTASSPTVTIGNKPATVSFSGLAPGFTGLYQLNVTVPSDAPTGVQPVVVNIGGVSSPQGNIAVQ